MSHSPFRLHNVGRDGVHRILVCWIGCHDRTYYKLLTQLACSDITLSGVRWLSAHNVSVFLLARFQVKSSKIIENGYRILVCWIGCHDRTYYKLLTQLACSDITLSGVRWLSAHNVSVFLLARFQVKSSKIIENGFGFWNTCKVPVIFFFVGFFRPLR